VQLRVVADVDEVLWRQAEKHARLAIVRLLRSVLPWRSALLPCCGDWSWY
jgi:hypothetical protein